MKVAAVERRLRMIGAGSRRLACMIVALCLAVQPALAQPNPAGAAKPAAAPPAPPTPASEPVSAAPATVAPEAPAPPPTAPAPAAQPAPPPPPVEADEADPRALTEFRPALDPYGRWVQDPAYGLVWVPHRNVVGRDFAPYVTSGRWQLTPDDQWIWVSDYPFGWVVFHYGRWVWTNDGWAWIPGYRYAPAWVDWRVADYDHGYVGWAPYPPNYVWFNGVAVSLWFTPYYAWVFCPSYHVFSPHVHHHIVRDRTTVYRVAAHTRVYRAANYRAAFPRSPTPAVARIPARAVPRQRTLGDPRSLEVSRRSVRDLSASRIAPAPRALTTPGAAGSSSTGVWRGRQRAPAAAAAPAAPAARRLPDARTAAPRSAAPRADGTAPAPRTRPAAPALGRPKVSTPPRRAPSAAPRSLPSRPMRSLPRSPVRRSR